MRAELDKGAVLIVDDDPFFAGRIAAIIEEIHPDWQIFTKSNGKHAIKLITESKTVFNLALVDIGLPDVSGLDVIKTFHAKFPESPVLVLSVISAEDTVFHAIKNGARGYLSKYDSATETKEAIRSILRGDYPISPSLARHLFKVIGPRTPSVDPGFLTTKEAELLQHLARGLTYSEAGRKMDIQISTVRTHIRNLYRKLDAHTQVQAVVSGRNRGLIE